MSAPAVRTTPSDDKFVRIAKAEAEAKRVAAVKARAAALAAEHQADVQHAHRIEQALKERVALIARGDEIAAPFRTVDALLAQAFEVLQAGLADADAYQHDLKKCCQVIAGGQTAPVTNLFTVHFRVTEHLHTRLRACFGDDFAPLFTGRVSKEDVSLAASAEYTVSRLVRMAKEVAP